MVINTADIRFYVSRLRLHTHHAAAQKLFVIENRIPRRHHRINALRVLPGENPHISRRVKLFHNRNGVKFVDLAADSPTLRSLNRLVHNLFYLRLRNSRAERTVVFMFFDFNPFKNRLKTFLFCTVRQFVTCSHVLFDSLFRIFLHTGIYRNVNFKTVVVDVVIFTVCFLVFITPAVKRISLPHKRVFMVNIVLPRCVINSFGLFGGHRSPQKFPEIRRKSFNVSILRKFQNYIRGFKAFKLRMRKHFITADIFADF